MVTMEIFVAAFSSLAVIVAGAFFWIMSEIRALRRETREDNRATRTEPQRPESGQWRRRSALWGPAAWMPGDERTPLWQKVMGERG